MAFIPLTLRDSFFVDPFFRSSWSEFDRLQEELMRLGTQDFWNHAGEEMRQMGHRNQGQDQVEDKSGEKADGQTNGKQVANNGKESDKNQVATQQPSDWVFPRRWMMPRLFGGMESDMAKALDLFQNTSDFHEVRIQNDDKKYEVSLDTHGFRPDELKINVKDNVLSIDARHEEKSEGRYVSRNFHRQYTLPKACEMDKITSNLSKDGILVIHAPKNPALMDDGSKAIPINYEK